MSDKDTSPGKHEETFSPSHVVSSAKNIHVIRRNDGWIVLGSGSSRDIVPTTNQREAVERAREIAATQMAEIVIHNRLGKIVGREVFRDQDWELETLEENSQPILEPNLYIDTHFYGERPHVRGRRVLVSMIAANHRDNDWSVARLAHEFSLSEEEVLAALLYYREHQAQIDAQDVEEQKQFDAMRQRYETDRSE